MLSLGPWSLAILATWKARLGTAAAVRSIGLATAQVTVLSSGCCIRNNYMSLQQTFVGSWEKALLLGEVQIHS